MKKSVCFLLLFVGLYSFNLVHSQENPVVIMQMESDGDKEQSKRMGSNHLIKVNPVLFLRGDLPIYYENNFNDNLSIECGIGCTVRDYYHNMLTDKQLNSYNTNITEKVKIGLSYRFAVRYYSTTYGYDPEGLYFGINFRHQTYNSTLEKIDDFTAKNEWLTSNYNDGFLSVGYVWVVDENAFIDPFVEFGVRSRNYTEVSGATPFYSITNQKDVVQLFMIGVKFSIAL